MATRKFPRDFMREIVWGDAEGVRIIDNTITGNGRWSIYHDMIFAYDGKFYGTSYSEGATESQDESPYEYDGEEIECVEVVPVPRTVVVYEPVDPSQDIAEPRVIDDIDYSDECDDEECDG